VRHAFPTVRTGRQGRNGRCFQAYKGLVRIPSGTGSQNRHAERSPPSAPVSMAKRIMLQQRSTNPEPSPPLVAEPNPSKRLLTKFKFYVPATFTGSAFFATCTTSVSVTNGAAAQNTSSQTQPQTASAPPSTIPSHQLSFPPDLHSLSNIEPYQTHVQTSPIEFRQGTEHLPSMLSSSNLFPDPDTSW
jgi:hypothetical protein